MDYYLRCGDSDFTAHHVVAVPDNPMFNAHMNATNTTEGGYVGSKMRTVYLRRAEAIFKACFGENHVLKHREYLVNAVADGRPSAGAWCDSVVELMDERMVYGSCIFDSASPDGTTVPNRYSVSSGTTRYWSVIISGTGSETSFRLRISLMSTILAIVTTMLLRMSTVCVRLPLSTKISKSRGACPRVFTVDKYKAAL